MHKTPAELIGPDFLQKLSEQQLSAGLETDFATLQANAKAWNAERAATTELRHTIDQQERDLRGVRAQLQQMRDSVNAAVRA